MAGHGKVIPHCPNASNPYHECGEYCVQKIGVSAKSPRDKKGLDYYNTDKDHDHKKMAGQRKVHRTCNNACNPYHECAEYCFTKNADANTPGTKKESGSISFGRRKKKGSESHPDSPQSDGSAKSHFVAKKKVEDRNGARSSSSLSPSEDISSGNSSFNKNLYQSSQLVPISGYVKLDQPKDGGTPLANGTEIKPLYKTPQALPTLRSFFTSEDAGGNKHPSSESRTLTSSVAVQATERNAEVEDDSIVLEPDTRVLVGKYNVKSSISSTLESIFHKYGDIAASCQLESLALRANYLECLCLVIQELQSTPFKYLTKSKVKEMLAILKDVESAQINVGWLRDILNQTTEALELVGQQRVAEVTKANCNRDLEKTKQELKSQLEELTQKEKELAYAKVRLDETRARLNKLELKSSQAKETTASLTSKIEKLHCKALLDEIL